MKNKSEQHTKVKCAIYDLVQLEKPDGYNPKKLGQMVNDYINQLEETIERMYQNQKSICETHQVLIKRLDKAESQQTLRDNMAMAALTGIVQRVWDVKGRGDEAVIKQWAETSYLVSDAMMEASKKGGAS